jgi:hypothetical protein
MAAMAEVEWAAMVEVEWAAWAEARQARPLLRNQAPVLSALVEPAEMVKWAGWAGRVEADLGLALARIAAVDAALLASKTITIRRTRGQQCSEVRSRSRLE